MNEATDQTINHQEMLDRKVMDFTFEQLDRELPDLCRRARAHIQGLAQWFVDRDEVIEIAMICAILGEPLLLLGPPGTAKSQLCSRFAESLHLSSSQRFEYLLTPFTEPSELFGPVDFDALKQGRFVRRHQGMLTHVKVAFLDEVFRANSAILNSLLSLLNEGKYFEDGQAHQAELSIIFAAANQLPNDQTLTALSDRFILKVPVHHTHQTHWDELLHKGLEAEGHKANQLAPWQNGPLQFFDLLKIRRYLQLSFSMEASNQQIRDRIFPPEVMALWRRILSALELDLNLYVSDRKIIRLYRLFRTRALLHGRATVQRDDLYLLRYLAQRPNEHTFVSERVDRMLQLSNLEA